MRLPSGPAVAALLAVAALIPAGTARGDEGRIPISGPVYISQPGHYILTRDFCFAPSPTPPCLAASIGILVASDDVTIDLNGRTISTSQNLALIYVNTATTRRGLTIRNGNLVGGGLSVGNGNDGIQASNDSPLEVRIEGLEIREMGGTGIDIPAAKSVRITGCRILSAEYGINIIGTTDPFDGLIADNLVSDVNVHGIYLQGLQNGQVLRNIVRNFGVNQTNAGGILLTSISTVGEAGGNLIEGNTATSGDRGIDDDGIAVLSFGSAAVPHNLIVDNVLKGNGRYGLYVSSDENRIERNVASRNGGDGIHVGLSTAGARNDLEGNQAQGNGGCGIAFTNSASHIYRNNVMRNNAGGDVCGFGAPSTNAGGP